MFSAQQFLFTMNLQQIRRSLWDLKHVKIRRATKSPVCWNPFHGRFKKNLLIPFVKHVVACCKGNGTVFDICPVVEWSEAAGSKWFVATIDLNRRVSLPSTWTLSEVSRKKNRFNPRQSSLPVVFTTLFPHLAHSTSWARRPCRQKDCVCCRTTSRLTASRHFLHVLHLFHFTHLHLLCHLPLNLVAAVPKEFATNTSSKMSRSLHCSWWMKSCIIMSQDHPKATCAAFCLFSDLHKSWAPHVSHWLKASKAMSGSAFRSCACKVPPIFCLCYHQLYTSCPHHRCNNTEIPCVFWSGCHHMSPIQKCNV